MTARGLVTVQDKIKNPPVNRFTFVSPLYQGGFFTALIFI